MRLTDDLMADIETKLGAIENEYRPECIRSSYGSGCAGATDESVAFWRAAVDRVPSMLAELRERRAADLTSDEREALGAVRVDIAEFNILAPDRDAFPDEESRYESDVRWTKRAIAVLDKILASLHARNSGGTPMSEAKHYAKKRESIRAAQWTGEMTPEMKELLGERAISIDGDRQLVFANAKGPGRFARVGDWIVSFSGEDLGLVGADDFRDAYEEVAS